MRNGWVENLAWHTPFFQPGRMNQIVNDYLVTHNPRYSKHHTTLGSRLDFQPVLLYTDCENASCFSTSQPCHSPCDFTKRVGKAISWMTNIHFVACWLEMPAWRGTSITAPSLCPQKTSVISALCEVTFSSCWSTHPRGRLKAEISLISVSRQDIINTEITPIVFRKTANKTSLLR